MKKDIFTAEGLERLRSPEKLDTLLQVTQPVSWMGLAALALMVLSVFLWSIFGYMSTNVIGSGMIVDTGGVVRVAHDSPGMVTEILVEPGTRVRKGDVVARLNQPILDNNIINSLESIQLSGNYREALVNLSTLDNLMVEREIRRQVTSPADGIVTGIDVNVGDMVSPATTNICTIRRDFHREDVTAYMYVPLDGGKKIKPGMTAQLIPSEADGDKNGYLVGVVRGVSLYPATSDSVVRTIGNPEAANYILSSVGGAAMEVRIELLKSEKSKSGHLWTAIVGTPPQISPGSFFTGNIVVEREAPLDRLILKLGYWLEAI